MTTYTYPIYFTKIGDDSVEDLTTDFLNDIKNEYKELCERAKASPDFRGSFKLPEDLDDIDITFTISGAKYNSKFQRIEASLHLMPDVETEERVIKNVTIFIITEGLRQTDWESGLQSSIGEIEGGGRRKKRCKSGSRRSRRTKRCIKKCKSGSRRNARTHRCRKLKL